jgi:hypothetical protein
MSEDGFHVHGPHDHEVEHAVEHGAGGMIGQLAVMTAILATIGAVCSYMGGAGRRRAREERRRDSQDGGVRPVELLPGQERAPGHR